MVSSLVTTLYIFFTSVSLSGGTEKDGSHNDCSVLHRVTSGEKATEVILPTDDAYLIQAAGKSSQHHDETQTTGGFESPSKRGFSSSKSHNP